MKNIHIPTWARCLLILAVCALLTAVLLPAVKPPFGVVFAGLALASLLCCVFIKKTWVTYATMVLLPLFAVSSIMEFHLQAMRDPAAPTREDGSYQANIIKHHPIHGYGPMQGQGQYDSRSKRGDTLLYDSLYTTNEQGWRITPLHPQARVAVVFFGCSFTWGQGVQDQETYPYRVASLLGENYQVYNLAFNGYGAHQLLAMAESDEFNELFKKYDTVYAFYLNIAMHEMRPFGYSEWDTQGPRYVLKDGVAVRDGNFAPWWNTSPTARKIYETLKKSFLYRDIFVRPREWALKDMRVLDNALMRQAGALLTSKYPNSNFTLLVYPNAVHHIPLQKEMGLNPVDVTAFFPLPTTDPRYVIPGEWHPSSEAYRVMAGGIAKFIRDQQAKAAKVDR